MPRRRVAAIAAALAFQAAVCSGAWVDTNYPWRACFEAPLRVTGDCVMASVPLEGAGPATALFACLPDGSLLPLREVLRETHRVCVAVGLGLRPSQRRFHVYLGGANPSRDYSEVLLPPDERPVKRVLYRSGSLSSPVTWDQMRYMYGTSYRASEDVVETLSYDRSEARVGPDRYGAIVVLQANLYCPVSGPHVFALRTNGRAFATVDRELVASATEGPDDELALPAGRGARAAEGSAADELRWVEGAPVVLRAGFHRIEVFGFAARTQYLVRAGWRPPGADRTEPVAGTNLFSSDVADLAVLERVDRPLNPGFLWAKDHPYTFRDFTNVFVRVSFADESTGRDASRTEARWDFGDGTADQDRTAIHAYRVPGVYTARLDLVLADGTVTGSVARVIDCRHDFPRHHGAPTFAVTGLGAVYYPGDPVEADLRIGGSFPGICDLTVRWSLAMSGGRTETNSALLTAAQAERVPEPVALLRGRAGSFRSLTWAVEHAGASVLTGRVEFMDGPAGALATRVSGDRLFRADGTRVAIVARRSAGPPAAEQPRGLRPGGIVWMDDFLSETAVRALAAAVGRPAESVRLPSTDESHDAYAPLLRLVSAAALADGDAAAIVVSVGLDDTLCETDPDAFERNLAALCDVLLWNARAPVLLVSPPPVRGDPMSARPYAAAVVRVGFSRGVPVADLFTAFMGRDREAAALFDSSGFRLSEAGVALSAEVFRRAWRRLRAEGDRGR